MVVICSGELFRFIFCGLKCESHNFLAGCEVTSDVNLATQKFNIKLFAPSQDGGGMSEMWIRQDTVSTPFSATFSVC